MAGHRLVEHREVRVDQPCSASIASEQPSQEAPRLFPHLSLEVLVEMRVVLLTDRNAIHRVQIEPRAEEPIHKALGPIISNHPLDLLAKDAGAEQSIAFGQGEQALIRHRAP